MTTRLLSALAPNERKKVVSSVRRTQDTTRKPVPIRDVINSPPAKPKIITLPDATGDCHIA